MILTMICLQQANFKPWFVKMACCKQTIVNISLFCQITQLAVAIQKQKRKLLSVRIIREVRESVAELGLPKRNN